LPVPRHEPLAHIRPAQHGCARPPQLSQPRRPQISVVPAHTPPAQQGWPALCPHVWQVPGETPGSAPWHARPLPLHTPPVQHGWPWSPHAPPPWHRPSVPHDAPPEHIAPAQHGCESLPHASHVMPLHTEPIAQRLPAQHASLG
jgi:hypothetical protein